MDRPQSMRSPPTRLIGAIKTIIAKLRTQHCRGAAPIITTNMYRYGNGVGIPGTKISRCTIGFRNQTRLARAAPSTRLADRAFFHRRGPMGTADRYFWLGEGCAAMESLGR